MDILTGVWPALATPFNPAGQVNNKTLRQLVERLIKAEVSGFYTCGATGEGLLLTTDERKSVTALVVKLVSGRVPVMAHVGALTTAEAAALAAHAHAVGADAVAAIPPSFYAVGKDGIRAYYEAIAKAAKGLPVYIYYLPARTGVTMSADMVRDLMQIEALRGIKFTSSDLFLMERIVDLGLNVLAGPDEMFHACLATGAHGAIGSTVNIMPRQFVALYRAFGAHDGEAARHMQGEINRVIGLLLESGNLIGALKMVLYWQGIECGEPRRPIPPLGAEAAARLRAALDAINFFDMTVQEGDIEDTSSLKAL
ncbi:MAG: dihydrodipicolinate synthase family protein [Anaerolineae bacterium]|nr:dihydrodipicolinate synthase family protein [Anaerolineae bacterium]